MFTDGTAPDTKPETESVKERMMSMLNRLDSDDLRSVCSVIEEKLRVRELERKVEELAKMQTEKTEPTR